MKETVEEKFNAIVEALKTAESYNLQIEVIYWAMKFARDNPEWTYAQCLDAALDEWDI